MFGFSPSFAAINACKIFKKNGLHNILELGAGQGRDSLFFAKSGFKVQALDYSSVGIKNIIKKANKKGLSDLITPICHDVRKELPFQNETFDSCFSHMLYCMAITTSELMFLSKEIYRILKPGGINIYTVRHTKDADYGVGVHKGEDLYETGGFIVHFFSRKKINMLSNGFKILSVNHFEEGTFPRKLFQVILKKI
tara:strand:+ start:186 stop:773 length:588 start_codon:yes stop_codon:yes gene_type:complete